MSLFAVSTFDTDFVLVKEDKLAAAVAALRSVGHTVREPPTPLLLPDWSCAHCTYAHHKGEAVCAMCRRPRPAAASPLPAQSTAQSPALGEKKSYEMLVRSPSRSFNVLLIDIC